MLARVFVTPSFSLFGTGARKRLPRCNDLRLYILQSRANFLSKLRTSHEQLIMEALKILKKDIDSPKRLDSLIQRYFPNHTGGDAFSISADNFTVDYQDHGLVEGNTLLNLAARHSKINCVKLLLMKYNANVNAGDVGGFTPLINAAYRGDLGMCRYLLKTTHKTLDIKAQGSERSGPKRSAEFWAHRKRFYRVQQLLASARRTKRDDQGDVLPWDFDLNQDVLPPGWEYVYTEQEQEQEQEQERSGRQGAAPDTSHTHHSSPTSFMAPGEGEGGTGGEEREYGGGGFGAPRSKRSRAG